MSQPIGGKPDGERIRVVVVDDQGVIRAGLRMIIDNEPDLVVVAEAADGLQAVEIVRVTRPDVVLMDIRMPVLDGLEATRRIMAELPHAPVPGLDQDSPVDDVPARSGTAVLVLTTFDDEEYVLGAIRAGAAGFLLKDAGPEALVSAIRTVHGGDRLVDPAVTGTLISRYLALEATAAPAPDQPSRVSSPWARGLASLSDREREILAGVARGLANRDLARELFLSEATVKTHVSNVLAKLGLRSRVEAVMVAYESGLIAPGSVTAWPPASA